MTRGPTPSSPPRSPVGSLPCRAEILRDIDLADDATQQALLTIWQDLPQLRDPARFDAWSYRLLVLACYAEGRKHRRWAPNHHAMRALRAALDADSRTPVREVI